MREQILAAANKLLMLQGYSGLAMRQIADEVGVSKAALYYHFKDKEQLFLQILNGYLQKIAQMLNSIETQTPDSRERIRLMIDGILSHPAEQRAVIRLAMQESAHLSTAGRQSLMADYNRLFLTRIQAILDSGVARGELRPLSPQVSTWALLGMLTPYFYPPPLGTPPTPEIISDLQTLFLQGLALPTGKDAA